MEKEEGQEQALEVPSIKKIINCPKCNAKIEVEFEIGLDMIMPALAGVPFPVASPSEEKADED